MAKKQFKAESKRLLGLMINSIYTNKEIFLREIISNASDALDKRYYLSLTDENQRISKDALKIHIERNPEERTLVIEDTGIGMNKTELENNLGTIARSGSAEFRENLEGDQDNIDIIGQFGVGFYSAFMVADKITVETRSASDEQAYRWVSSGEDGYTIDSIEKEDVGTKIILELKQDTEDEKYSEYLEEYTIRELIRKYSDYVRYPITMMTEKQIPDPTEEGKTMSVMEEETLNSMIPLWKKSKNSITDEEYNEFYKAKFNDWKDPLKTIHYTVEGTTSYTALLYIPSEAPYNFYNTDFESGLQLYSKGVFIMDKAKDLLPDCYRFVTGLVDSEDLSLNISREILQQDRQVKALAKSIEKKIHDGISDMMENDREKYEMFFSSFGRSLKYDIYRTYGADGSKLKDFLMYRSSKDGKYVSLKEYTDRMSEDQKEIYYACGSSIDEIEKLPVLRKLKEKDFEILYFTEDLDEFTISMLGAYNDKPFHNVTKGDLDLDTEEEKKEREEKAEANKDMLTAMKEALGDDVKDVRISSRLVDDPVCLVADEGMSLEMEKILSRDPSNPGMKAAKILEINPNHPIFETLSNLYSTQPETVKSYAKVLLDQALLIEGLPIDDPVDYARRIVDLMISASIKN